MKFAIYDENPYGEKVEVAVFRTLKDAEDYFIEEFCEGISDNPVWNANMKNQIVEIEDHQVSGYNTPTKGSVPGAAAVAGFAAVF